MAHDSRVRLHMVSLLGSILMASSNPGIVPPGPFRTSCCIPPARGNLAARWTHSEPGAKELGIDKRGAIGSVLLVGCLSLRGGGRRREEQRWRDADVNEEDFLANFDSEGGEVSGFFSAQERTTGESGDEDSGWELARRKLKRREKVGSESFDGEGLSPDQGSVESSKEASFLKQLSSADLRKLEELSSSATTWPSGGGREMRRKHRGVSARVRDEEVSPITERPRGDARKAEKSAPGAPPKGSMAARWASRGTRYDWWEGEGSSEVRVGSEDWIGAGGQWGESLSSDDFEPLDWRRGARPTQPWHPDLVAAKMDKHDRDSDEVEWNMSSNDEYFDFYKYRVKRSSDTDRPKPQDQLFPPNRDLLPCIRESMRLVMPLAATRSHAEILRERFLAARNITDVANGDASTFEAVTQLLDEGAQVAMAGDLFLPDEAHAPQIDSSGRPRPFSNYSALWEMTTEQLLEVDNATSATMQRALLRLARTRDAGPDWAHLPRRPDFSKRPDLRSDFKLLTQRNTWDPKHYYKSIGWERKGTNVKSKRKITYPEYMLEGYVLPDPKRPQENLPRSLRGKSLTQQLLADEAIRLNLKRRFKKKMQAAGGWHEKRGKDGKTRVPDKTSKRRAKPVPLEERSIKEQIESARIERLLHEAEQDGAYSDQDYAVPPIPVVAVHRGHFPGVAKRELPVMPSMGGTGKIEAPGQGPMAEKIREKKRKHKLRQEARAARRSKRRIMGTLHPLKPRRLGR